MAKKYLIALDDGHGMEKKGKRTGWMDQVNTQRFIYKWKTYKKKRSSDKRK